MDRSIQEYMAQAALFAQNLVPAGTVRLRTNTQASGALTTEEDYAINRETITPAYEPLYQEAVVDTPPVVVPPAQRAEKVTAMVPLLLMAFLMLYLYSRRR